MADKKIETAAEHKHVKARTMDSEKMQSDMSFHFAENVLDEMVSAGLVSKEERVQISQLNRETFSPFLVELMT